MKRRILACGIFSVAIAGCASEDGVANPSHAAGGSSGSGIAGSGGFPNGGSGGSSSGGAPSCEPSAPTTGSYAVLSKDVPVTSTYSQRAIAIAFDGTAHAWALANVIEVNGNFPLELRKAIESGGELLFSERVLALDASAPSLTNTFDPMLAAASESSRVLLVWSDDRLGNGNGMLEIFGQFFDLSAAVPQKIGENFAISQQPTTNDWRPGVAFDSAGKKFWVAWADDRSFAQTPGARYEYARSVDLDGALGAELALGDQTTWQDGVHAAVGSAGPIFVWSEFSDIGGFGRYRARLSSQPGALIDLYESTTLSPGPPDVAWDAKRCRFLAVWQETASANAADKQIWGQLLGPDGAIVKARFQITNQPAGAGSPHLDYSATTQSFVLTFGSWTDSDAYVLELDGVGQPVGAPTSLHASAPTNGTYYHDLAAGDASVLAITNEDYARIEATLLGHS